MQRSQQICQSSAPTSQGRPPNPPSLRASSWARVGPSSAGVRSSAPPPRASPSTCATASATRSGAALSAMPTATTRRPSCVPSVGPRCVGRLDGSPACLRGRPAHPERKRQVPAPRPRASGASYVCVVGEGAPSASDLWDCLRLASTNRFETRPPCMGCVLLQRKGVQTCVRILGLAACTRVRAADTRTTCITGVCTVGG